ncbi:MAG: hypothetical protein Q9191_006393 [Dirinaria sp. TL-2023a]
MSGFDGSPRSLRSLPGHSPSAEKSADPPVGDVEIDLETLRLSQETIPSNPNATRRLPQRADFPSSISIDIVQPVENKQIKFAIVLLQDHGVAQRSLEQLARKLQRKYPENTYVLIRCQEPTSDNMYGRAGAQEDHTFGRTCWMLLLDVIRDCLILKCGFKTRQIVILGHGQGGTAALMAVSLWGSTQFAGVIAIGSPRLTLDCQTPALQLGNFPESNTTNAVLPQITGSNHLIPADMQNLADITPELSEGLLQPINEFFAHRLRREEWTKQAILSLDGGGIRGYASLLILRELMNKIGDEEKKYDLEEGPAHSSFFPSPFRPISAQSAMSKGAAPSPELLEGSPIVPSPHGNLPNSSLFYPCHYFTYAAGTSTGGVTAQYSDQNEDRLSEVQFPSNESLCRTVVLAYANTSENAEVPHIFRTYGTPTSQPDRTKSIPRQRSARSHGPAPGLPIWQIARATSAAPGYFPPMKIQRARSLSPNEVILFKDGGFGANNPSKEALEDIVHKHGAGIRSIGPFVSVGTGAHSEPIFAKKPGKWQNFKANVRAAVAHPARTKGTADDIAYLSSPDGEEQFPYYRFEGGEHLGRIAMDEWKSVRFPTMRGKNSMRGYKTIDSMDQATSVYLLDRDVQEDLKELAKILVKRRRLRAKDSSAWDKYASASYFECTHKGCEHRRIETSDEYKEHLRDEHGKSMTRQELESDIKRSKRCWLYKSKEP